MQLRFVRSFLVATAVAGGFVAASCDKENTPEPDVREDETPDESEELAEPSFDWKRAAKSPPDAVEESVGPFEGACDPERSLSGPETDRGFATNRGCRLPRSEGDRRPKYRVHRILYSNNEPAAIYLRLDPKLELPFSAEGLDALDLPRLDVRRTYSPESEDGPEAVRGFRRERIGSGVDPGAVLGVDLAASSLKASVAERARLYIHTSDGTGHQLANWRGPPTTHRRLLLPVALRSAAEHADVAVELGVDDIRLRRWNDYPVRRPESEVVPAPVRFARRAMGPEQKDSDWESEVEKFVADLSSSGDAPDDEPPRATFGIGATQTAPIGQFESLLGILDGASRASFQLLVRTGDRIAAEFTEFPRRGALRVRLPSTAPEARSRTGESFLNLRVRASIEGFEITAGGKTLPPIRDCPDPGPTICPARPEVDMKAMVERAESLQRANNLAEADTAAAKAVGRFDWAALYRNLRRIHDRYSKASRIYLSAEPGLPVAVVVRMMSVSRFRLRDESADDCSIDFAADEPFRETVPCEREDGEPKKMFERQYWSIE